MKYKKHGAEQRTMILSHARSMFIEKGVPSVTMSEVAIRCGITRATLYRYYENKDQLLWGVYDLCTQSLFSRLSTQIETFSGTTYERFVYVKNLLEESFYVNREFFLFNDAFNSLYQQATADLSQNNFRQHRDDLGPGDTVRFLTQKFYDGSIRDGLEPVPTAVAFLYGCIAIYTKFTKVGGILPRKYGVQSDQEVSFCTQALLDSLRP